MQRFRLASVIIPLRYFGSIPKLSISDLKLMFCLIFEFPAKFLHVRVDPIVRVFMPKERHAQRGNLAQSWPTRGRTPINVASPNEGMVMEPRLPFCQFEEAEVTKSF